MGEFGRGAGRRALSDSGRRGVARSWGRGHAGSRIGQPHLFGGGRDVCSSRALGRARGRRTVGWGCRSGIHAGVGSGSRSQRHHSDRHHDPGPVGRASRHLVHHEDRDAGPTRPATRTDRDWHLRGGRREVGGRYQGHCLRAGVHHQRWRGAHGGPDGPRRPVPASVEDVLPGRRRQDQLQPGAGPVRDRLLRLRDGHRRIGAAVGQHLQGDLDDHHRQPLRAPRRGVRPGTQCERDDARRADGGRWLGDRSRQRRQAVVDEREPLMELCHDARLRGRGHLPQRRHHHPDRGQGHG